MNRKHKERVTTVHIEVTNSSQWNECLRYMSRRTREQSFNTWLKSTMGRPNGNDQFYIAVPNQFVADWIKDHFSDLINEAMTEVLGRTYDVQYVVKSDPTAETQLPLDLHRSTAAPSAAPTRQAGPTAPPSLSDRYCFQSLVVGDFNQFACAASVAVAEEPGATKYNPLYIYGPTGLGKTHIVQAIGNKTMELYPEKRVMYATSEKFTNDFITSISERSISDFTRLYRNVDVLIIDDIQFFTGKESTQEQFFHTFNALYQDGKQIVLTSDRPPKEIKGLEERLLSRFSWGLVTDLQAPDLEARTAILYKKLQHEGNELADDVVRLIADRISTNIRDLEGALTRILAYSSLKGVGMDVDTAAGLLADTAPSRRKNISIDAIQQKTAELFEIPADMMKAKKKTAEVVLARQVAMYLSRSLTRSSLKSIGDAFGGRDHSTVIHACDTISRRMSEDADLKARIDQVSGRLLY